MSTYQLFTNKDEKYEAAETSIGNARRYSKLIVTCATRSMQERIDLARQWGWDSAEAQDKVFYEDYQRERACILFPDAKKEITKNAEFLNVSEVDKAESFFSKATGLALNGPSLSLRELMSYLNQVNITPKMEDSDQALTSETE